MREFVKTLQKGTFKKLERIERSDLTKIGKSLEAAHLLAEDFEKLKEFITNYTFRSEEEEIEFFKKIKPSLFCRLIYYRQVYNIEMNRPVAGIEAQRDYLCAELKAITNYNDKRIDLIRYYRSGATYLDATYFLRGQTDTEQYLEPFFYEFDPQFSTNADSCISKILANDMLSAYLIGEVEALESRCRPSAPNPFPEVRITWQDSKTDLTELIYSLHSKGSFGNVSLKLLSDYLFNVFNVPPDNNISRTFSDIKIRNKPTQYLEELIVALQERVRYLRKNGKINLPKNQTKNDKTS